ncbi:MAG: hypothetical protein HDT26_00605 [Subdoligranulum sp.]|nr:hypothetical protein [Subdoligranulum sp.]
MEQSILLEETRRTNELLQKQLLWSRITAAFLAAVLAAVVLFFGSIAYSVDRIAGQIEEMDLDAISAQLSEIDFAALAEKIEQIDFSSISSQISELDIEAFNGTLTTLEEKLGEMDTQAFNDTVKKLNTAVDALQSASDTIKRWGEGLSGIFGR